MEKDYIKGLGVLIGEFTEEELKEHKDRIVIEEKKKELGLKYINAKEVKRKGIKKLAVYLCNAYDFKI